MAAVSRKVKKVKDKVDNFPGFVIDEISKSEDGTHDKIIDQVSSLKNMNEIRFTIFEGRINQA